MSRFRKAELLRKAPKWFVDSVISETGATDLEGYGLPNDHASFDARQRSINRREQAKLDGESAVERIRRIARAKRESRNQ